MKKLCVFFFSCFLFVLLSPRGAYSNNLVISNVTLEDRNPSANTIVVQFNISWDHSWRKNDGRHDTAWVFFKIYDATSDLVWYHAPLYTAGTNPSDSSPGSNPDLKIVVPSDKIGAFISRQATGNGTFSSQKVRLTINNTRISDSSTVQVKVFGIEMVYIPEGPFYVGDGNGSQESTYAFHDGIDDTAVQITTAGIGITVDSNGDDDIDTTPRTVVGGAGISGVNTSWPDGYNDFYLMKYEISQGQYVDFLNTLTRAQQGHRVRATVSGDTIASYFVMQNGPFISNRQGIRAPASGNGTSPTKIVFSHDFNNNGTLNESDDGSNIPVSYLGWTDLLAYADWAGLRPYTELEFEKAARGPNSAVYGEYAWGNTTLTAVSGPTNSGRSNEVSSTSGEGLAVYGNSVAGPLRVGFAATTATNRKSAGAGYYGNMELSGNELEPAISLGMTAGRAFSGTHGDGTLTSTSSYEGNATNTDWPGIDATTARGVTAASGYLFRGGDFFWGSGNGLLIVSDRHCNDGVGGSTGRSNNGGRLARTAP